MFFKSQKRASLLGILISITVGSLFSMAYAHEHLGSSTGTELNGNIHGGDLGSSDACNAEEPLVALVPTTNPVDIGFPLFTISAHPTLLFSTPYSQDDIRYGEFTINEYERPHDRKKLYETEFDLPTTPGIVSLTIPNAPEYSLVPYKDYRWRFKLHCDGGQTLSINGYIRRINSTPEFEMSIDQGEANIWYDAIATLANKLRSAQTSLTAEQEIIDAEQLILDAEQENIDKERWNTLTNYIGLDEETSIILAPERLVGPVIFRVSD